MTVTVRLPINATEVYHTRECKNCARIRNPREISKDHAERIGLTECVHCTGQYAEVKEEKKAYYRAVRDANTLKELSENVNASNLGD